MMPEPIEYQKAIEDEDFHLSAMDEKDKRIDELEAKNRIHLSIWADLKAENNRLRNEVAGLRKGLIRVTGRYPFYDADETMEIAQNTLGADFGSL